MSVFTIVSNKHTPANTRIYRKYNQLDLVIQFFKKRDFVDSRGFAQRQNAHCAYYGFKDLISKPYTSNLSTPKLTTNEQSI